jgi:hypothetical protein
VPKTAFCRHYIGQDMKTLGSSTIKTENNLEKIAYLLANYYLLRRLISLLELIKFEYLWIKEEKL